MLLAWPELPPRPHRVRPGAKTPQMKPLSFQLCYITDRLGLAAGSLLPRIREAARAGVDLIQLREKDLPTQELLELLEAAIGVCRETGTKIVINDRLDIALGAG